jgi:hypothetical protein
VCAGSVPDVAEAVLARIQQERKGPPLPGPDRARSLGPSIMGAD